MYAAGYKSATANGFVGAGDFVMMDMGNGGGKIYLAAYWRRGNMFYGEAGAYSFFGILFHLQHKEAAAPFRITGQRKGGVHGMHGAVVESGAVFLPYNTTELLCLAGLEEMVHSTKLKLNCIIVVFLQ